MSGLPQYSEHFGAGRPGSGEQLHVDGLEQWCKFINRLHHTVISRDASERSLVGSALCIGDVFR